MKSQINLVKAGIIRKSHNAMQGNHNKRSGIGGNTREMLIIQNTKQLNSDATTQNAQQRRECERRKTWDVGSKTKTRPLSVTPTQ